MKSVLNYNSALPICPEGPKQQICLIWYTEIVAQTEKLMKQETPTEDI